MTRGAVTGVVSRSFAVLAAGPLTTVQDLGRPGWAHLGVPRSGAADVGALSLANRLVGNVEGAAALEVTLGGFAARARADLTVAVTGASCPIRIGGVDQPRCAVLAWPRDADLALGAAPAGLRAYLGVHGGLTAGRVLGSAATDTLSGLGPPVVRDGDVLSVGAADGPAVAGWPLVELAPVNAPPNGDVALRALAGPRDTLLEHGFRRFGPFTVSERSDRIGIRLAGSPVRIRAGARLPSEGLVRGAVQIPPSGEPVIFLADHPVTGGYPVVAVLLEDDADRAAQLRPGQSARLTLVS